MQEEKRSYLIKATNKKTGDFTIPVIYVRDGKDERELVNKIQYNSNRNRGSKYMRPSFSVGGNSYQNSHRKPQ